MRQIGTLPDADDARRLADYLATIDVETHLDQETGGWAVWVCDEDRVPRAKEVFAEFRVDPKNERFRAPPRTISIPVREEPRSQPSVDVRDPLEHPPASRPPLTLAFILACVVIGVASNFGGYGFDVTRDREEPPGKLVQLLSISSYDITRHGRQTFIDWTNYRDLQQVRDGDVWRLVTPIFIHYGILHLVFNILMLRTLGGSIERQRGPWILALLVIAIAIPSNLAQYSMYYLKFVAGEDTLSRFHLGGGPAFGGFSGVLFGLLGYVIVKAWLQPEQGLTIRRSSVIVMIVWFVLCFTGLLGPVANVAHMAGFVAGFILGWLGYLGSRLFRGWPNRENR
jgi:GlpG protein